MISGATAQASPSPDCETSIRVELGVSNAADKGDPSKYNNARAMLPVRDNTITQTPIMIRQAMRGYDSRHLRDWHASLTQTPATPIHECHAT